MSETHKPARNWRGYLKEYAIIVVGVLTALAAQQAAEWWQWRGKVAYATDQIQRELAESMAWSMERIMVEGCIQRRLDFLSEKLLASGESWKAVAPAGTAGIQAGNVVAIPNRDWSAIVWTAAVADTSVTHFGRDRLTAYARIYGFLDLRRTQNRLEYENVARLNILSKPLLLSNDKKVELLTVIEMLRVFNRGIALNSSRLLDAKAWQGIGLDPAEGRARVVKESTTYAAGQATPR